MQKTLFDQPVESGYSWNTSLPAYHDKQVEKQRQANLIYSMIKNGADNLLKISELVLLPQSTVAGRCNDLLKEGKVKYEGFTEYRNRKRKRIVVIQK